MPSETSTRSAWAKPRPLGEELDPALHRRRDGGSAPALDEEGLLGQPLRRTDLAGVERRAVVGDEGEAAPLGLRVLEERQGEGGGPDVLLAAAVGHGAALVEEEHQRPAPQRLGARELVGEGLPLDQAAEEVEPPARVAQLRELRREHPGEVAALADVGELVGAVPDPAAALRRGDSLHASGEAGDPPQSRVGP